MRLIDADKLKEHKFLTPDAEEAKKWLPAETQGYQLGWNDAIDAIVDNVPPIEVRDNFDVGYVQGLEDGRKERPQGEFTIDELKMWLYAIAQNNDNDFGNGCLEIVGRLDGFKRFVADARGEEEG